VAFLELVEAAIFFGGTLAVATRALWYELSVSMDEPACFKTACTRDIAYAGIDELKPAKISVG
jgi:hypothetical protein